MKKLILKFVLRYIRTHMGHSIQDERAAIFNAIATGLSEEFNEDNIYTQTYDFVRWYAENNPGFKDILVTEQGKDLAMNAAEGLLYGIRNGRN